MISQLSILCKRIRSVFPSNCAHSQACWSYTYSACGRLKNTDLPVLNAIVEGIHEFQLNAIGLEGMVIVPRLRLHG